MITRLEVFEKLQEYIEEQFDKYGMEYVSLSLDSRNDARDCRVNLSFSYKSDEISSLKKELKKNKVNNDMKSLLGKSKK